MYDSVYAVNMFNFTVFAAKRVTLKTFVNQRGQ